MALAQGANRRVQLAEGGEEAGEGVAVGGKELSSSWFVFLFVFVSNTVCLQPTETKMSFLAVRAGGVGSLKLLPPCVSARQPIFFFFFF